jgi:diguanylate cyclase (GGDEF)-like protein
LFYLRRSLTKVKITFWLLLWCACGVGSMFAFHYLSATGGFFIFFYAPMQVAFAIGLVVIAVRIEKQRDQIRGLHDEMHRLRKESASQLDLDPLTGLLNRSALARWMEEERDFLGLVVVCDMDDFKQLNDVFGHLVGDEILHGVGHLLRASIREQDLAFRWGGDEFVLFFRNQDRHIVEDRMRELQERLRSFHIRHHGPTAVCFSWGVASATGRALRESLAEADRAMYNFKRVQHGHADTGRRDIASPDLAKQDLTKAE